MRILLFLSFILYFSVLLALVVVVSDKNLELHKKKVISALLIFLLSILKETVVLISNLSLLFPSREARFKKPAVDFSKDQSRNPSTRC